MGLPIRALACSCERPLVFAGDDEDVCLRCGRHDELTIEATWRDRALVLAQPSKPKSVAELVAA